MIVSNTFRPGAVVVALFLVLMMYSCKKEGADKPEPPTPVDPPVQVVPDSDGSQADFISIPYTRALDSASYHATLGNLPIQVLNSGDTALLLAMPAAIDTGIVTLHIPGLGSFEYHIHVTAAPAVPDVDAAYAVIAGNIESIAAQIGQLGPGVSPVGYEAFRAHLNRLSVTEKAQVVRYFRAIQQLQPGDATASFPGLQRPQPYKMASISGVPYAVGTAATPPASQWTVQYAVACFNVNHYATYALLAAPESPEKLFITYIALLYGQLATHSFEALSMSNPVIDAVYFSPGPMNPPADTGPRPDNYPVFRAGVPFPIYASLARRPITLGDRPQHDGPAVPPMMDLLFEAYDLMPPSIAQVNASMAQLATFPFMADVPQLEHVPLPSAVPESAYLWESLPESWMAENFQLQDTLGRFQLTNKTVQPGLAELNVGYAGDFRAAYRQVYGTAMYFAFHDDFNILQRQLPLRIQAPDPASITVETVGGTPPRFTLPYGRMEFQLKASVHPAEAPQEVAWSVTSGHKLAQVGQDGMVYSTFFATKDTTGYGYSTVRARFAEDANVYADFEVKTTSYKIKYESGAGQSFISCIPNAIQVSVQDRLDGSCLINPIAPRTDNAEEKLELKGFAVNARFTIGNDFVYRAYSYEGWPPPPAQLCAVDLAFCVPRRGVDPYDLPVWVYLYQDEHIIDRLAIYVHIEDYKP